MDCAVGGGGKVYTSDNNACLTHLPPSLSPAHQKILSPPPLPRHTAPLPPPPPFVHHHVKEGGGEDIGGANGPEERREEGGRGECPSLTPPPSPSPSKKGDGGEGNATGLQVFHSGGGEEEKRTNAFFSSFPFSSFFFCSRVRLMPYYTDDGDKVQLFLLTSFSVLHNILYA